MLFRYRVIGRSISLVIGLALLPVFLAGCGDDDEELNIPLEPKGLAHTLSNDKDMVSLSWKAVEYAETYRIYRGTQVDGDFETIGTSSTANYNDTQVVRGSIYIYKVAGVSGEGVEGEPSAPYQVIVPGVEPVCSVAPTEISFHRAGEMCTLTIQNTGSGILEWEIQNVPEWLDIGKTTGQTGEEFPSELQVTVNEVKLQPNETHTVTIIIVSNDSNAPERTINVTFSPPPKLLLVRDLRSGVPVADASLEIEGNGISESFKTDDSGEYAFEPEKDGIYAVSVSKSGYMPGVHEINTSLKDEFELTLKPIPKVIGTIKSNAWPFNTPAYAAFSTDGNWAYVTNRDGNNVSVINASTDRVLGAIDVGGGPTGLVINPRVSQLYVVNSQDDTVSVIDTNANKVVGDPVEVGTQPIHAAVNDFGTSLYVTNAGENSVSVVNLVLLIRESHRIDVGKAPYGVARSLDDRYLFVPNASDDSISVVALLTRNVERTIPAGDSPRDIAYVYDENLNNGYVLVTSFLGGNMVVYDVGKTSVEMHELGQFPTGIAIVSEPDDSYTAYTAVRGEALVRIFDFATMQVVDESIRVGASPIGVTAHPDGDKIYVVNSESNSVTVLGY